MPLVKLLRTVEQEGVEAYWFFDSLCPIKLPAQDLGANALVLEFGKNQQFMQIEMVVMF